MLVATVVDKSGIGCLRTHDGLVYEAGVDVTIRAQSRYSPGHIIADRLLSDSSSCVGLWQRD
ncbi:MAG: hypothetical protein R3C56_42100, partial [Pirellulaceae bacterium]